LGQGKGEQGKGSDTPVILDPPSDPLKEDQQPAADPPKELGTQETEPPAPSKRQKPEGGDEATDSDNSERCRRGRGE
jgi:hypothetical protein